MIKIWTIISKINTKGKHSNNPISFVLILWSVSICARVALSAEQPVDGHTNFPACKWDFEWFLLWYGYISPKHQRVAALPIPKLTWKGDISVFVFILQYRSWNRMMILFGYHQNYVDIVWRGSWQLTLKEISYCSPPQISKPGS